MNAFVDVLKAIVAHASEEEPRANILVLLFCDWRLALSTAVDKNCSKMAWKLALVLGN